MPDDIEDSNSFLEGELETLLSIYISDLIIEDNDLGKPATISIDLHPATADNVDEQYVRMTLIFNLSEEYPDNVPEIIIRNPRGLSDEKLNRITQDLVSIAEDKKGSSMLYELIEAAKEHLTTGNRPSGQCAICLYGFSEIDVFTRTECYHYFHSHCLARYAQHVTKCDDSLSANETEPEISKKELLCPMCRIPVVFHGSETDYPAPSAAVEDTISINQELRERRKEMDDLYQKQIEQGGIIDIEAEKNKFLLEISNVPTRTNSAEKSSSDSKPITPENPSETLEPRSSDGETACFRPPKQEKRTGFNHDRSQNYRESNMKYNRRGEQQQQHHRFDTRYNEGRRNNNYDRRYNRQANGSLPDGSRDGQREGQREAGSYRKFRKAPEGFHKNSQPQEVEINSGCVESKEIKTENSVNKDPVVPDLEAGKSNDYTDTSIRFKQYRGGYPNDRRNNRKPKNDYASHENDFNGRAPNRSDADAYSYDRQSNAHSHYTRPQYKERRSYQANRRYYQQDKESNFASSQNESQVEGTDDHFSKQNRFNSKGSKYYDDKRLSKRDSYQKDTQENAEKSSLDSGNQFEEAEQDNRRQTDFPRNANSRYNNGPRRNGRGSRYNNSAPRYNQPSQNSDWSPKLADKRSFNSSRGRYYTRPREEKQLERSTSPQVEQVIKGIENLTAVEPQYTEHEAKTLNEKPIIKGLPNSSNFPAMRSMTMLPPPPGFANPLKKVIYGLPSANPPPGFHRS